MSIDRYLVDTNILVYALYPSAAQHAASRALMATAVNSAAGLCVVPQMLAEFFAVVTNPKRVTPAKSSADAIVAIEQYLSLPGLTLLPVPSDLVTRWVDLVRARPVTGADVFDVQVVAVMMANGLIGLYTYNVTDFQGYAGIQPKEPPTVAPPATPAVPLP